MERDIFSVIKKPLSTEKAVRLIDSQNTLCFVVKKGVTKKDIKEAVESYFNVKILKVNTMLSMNGEKRAFVRLTNDYVAMDIATQLGLI